MTPRITHFPVHWQNGMKVAERHLRQQENAWLDHQRDASQYCRKPWEYGLLEGLSSGQAGLNLEISPELISVRQCRGLTAGGHRIELINGQDNPLALSLGEVIKQDLQDPKRTFYLLLFCNPFDRFPTGEFDTGETGRTRRAFSQPRMRLELASVEKTRLKELVFQLPLAKLVVEENGFKVLDDFLPPSISMKALPALVEFQESVLEKQQLILKKTASINTKIRALRRQQMGVSSEAASLDGVAGKVSYFLSSELDKSRLYGTARSPIDACLDVICLARVTHMAFDGLPNREDVLNLIESHLTLKPHQVASPLKEIILMNYEHENVKPIIDKCENVLSLLAQIFGGLEQLNQFKSQTSSGNTFFQQQ